MASTSCNATIRSASDNSLAYVRVAPGVANPILGQAPVGVDDYPVVEARLDATGLAWVRLQFADGTSGWVSSDRIDIVGECSTVGYGVVSQPTQASKLRLGSPTTPPPTTDTIERIRKAAFNITIGFEGGAYSTYQNYDAGIVSYGRFGFTLASGSLYSVLELYLRTANDVIANQLRNQYLERVRVRDWQLRNDLVFKDLLIMAAASPIMRQAQDQIATTQYWDFIQELSVKPRGIVLALSQAFFFDTGINHGARHDMITMAEDYFDVPQKSVVGRNGISEQQLIAKVAEIRRDRLYAIADAQNLPGLKPRGDFWVNIVKAGDWALQGDSSGNVLIKSGRSVQVRNP